MNYLEEVDISLSEDGDIVLCEEEGVVHEYCEIQFVENSQYIKQIVFNRIKTMKPDWFYDHVGANLEELLGKDNVKETALIGADLITEALTSDNFISPENIYIRPSPVDEFTMLYLLAIRVTDLEQLVFKVNIALSSGINVEEV